MVKTPLDPLAAGALGQAGDFDVQYRLPISFPTMPPGAVEETNLGFALGDGLNESDDLFRLRLHSATGFHDFDFRLQISMQSKSD